MHPFDRYDLLIIPAVVLSAVVVLTTGEWWPVAGLVGITGVVIRWLQRRRRMAVEEQGAGNRASHSR